MPKANKIKLIQVIADSAMGGGPRHVLGILKHLDKERFDLILIAPRGWLATAAAKIKNVGIRIVEFKSKFDLSSAIKLKKNIAEFRASDNPFGPIIIHAHGPRAGYFCRMAIRTGERFVYTEHLWNQDFHLQNPLNSFIQIAGLKSICKKADLVIAVSDSVRRFLLAKIAGIKEKLKVIPNAIEISGDKPKIHRSQRETGEFLIGTVGALNCQKGQIYLIRAMRRIIQSLPRTKLEIIGSGPNKEFLQREINRLGLEAKIQLLGEQKNIKKFVKEWDLFVLPSLSETFGLSVLEAMELVIPVVATSVGGLPEIIKDGETGVLVPPADSEKLAKAILHLLTEKSEREKLSRAAFSALKKNFDWSKIIVELEKVYLALAK